MKTPVPNRVRCFYEFGPFRLDPQRRRLLRGDEIVSLYPKAIETLILLVRNPGRVLAREELIQALWPDAIVEDANLTVAISQLRKALGQDIDGAYFIETIPRVGYRFVVEAKEVTEEPALVSFLEETRLIGAGASNTEKLDHPVGSNRRGRTHRISWRGYAVISVSLTGLVVAWWEATRPQLPASPAEVKSMAVLPLRTLEPKPADDYVGLGLADPLITQLGRIKHIPIRPISAVQRYSGSRLEDPVAAGRELHVEAVLEGSLQREADRTRVTMRLLRVGDGVDLWSARFEESSQDPFALQDSISEQVAQAMIPNLTQAERRTLTAHQTEDIQAYQSYAKGRYFWNKRTVTGLQRSIDYFQAAIALDPRYAAAYAGLADSYALLVWQDAMAPKDLVLKAKTAAAQALTLDETLGEAHASLGFVKFWYDWDFKGAESEYRRAVELNPGYATAHHWYGEYLVLAGRTNEGFRELRLAQESDPLSLIINADIGKLLCLTRQPDRAIEQLQKTLEIDPEFPLTHLFLAMAFDQKKMREEAIGQLNELANRPGTRAIFKAELANIYAHAGEKMKARNILNDLQAHWPVQQPPPAFEIALIYVGLDEKELALDWLQKAKAEHEPFLLYIGIDPAFDSLRSDSRVALFRKPL